MSQSSVNYQFGGLSLTQSDKAAAKFVILPIPYEATTSYGTGTKHGPQAIIDASTNLELFDDELHQETGTLGIYTLPPFKPQVKNAQQMTENIYEFSKQEIQSNKTLISLGGEHSISLGLVKAFKEKHNDLSVLMIDAHADLRNSYEENTFSHACVARRITEIAPLVSIGTRSLSKKEADFIKETNHNIFWKKEALKDQKQIGNINSLLSKNIYISIDVDIFDPAIIPATGTPEPDGWSWSELTNFLKKIILSKNVVGLDIVELAPMSGYHAADFTIAKLIYRLMGYLALDKKQQPNR